MRAKRAKTFDMGGQVFDEGDKGQIRGGGDSPLPQHLITLLLTASNAAPTTMRGRAQLRTPKSEIVHYF